MDQEYFKGKTAIVTGAGSGIGLELVIKLTSLGTHVIAVSQTKAKLDALKERLGDTITSVCVDLADWAQTEEKLAFVRKQDIDFLVNNAGYSYTAPLDEIPEKEIDRIFAINVKAPIHLTQMVAKRMRERSRGSIVNVSSVASLAAVDDHVAYAASKAALDMVTKCCSKELGSSQVRVNAVNPTVVWTEMGQKHWSEPTKKAHILSKIPMGRFVEVREVVDPIVSFLGKEMSMITGVTVAIDGGYSAT